LIGAGGDIGPRLPWPFSEAAGAVSSILHHKKRRLAEDHTPKCEHTKENALFVVGNKAGNDALRVQGPQLLADGGNIKLRRRFVVLDEVSLQHKQRDLNTNKTLPIKKEWPLTIVDCFASAQASSLACRKKRTKYQENTVSAALTRWYLSWVGGMRIPHVCARLTA
jgi:hypothetical protein